MIHDPSSDESSGRSDTPWLHDPSRERVSLEEDLEVDVCVVGGGIAGLTTAYLLALERKRVALLEDGRLGSGETGRTSAHLSSVLDDRFSRLARLHGESAAGLAYRAHVEAIDWIETLVRKHHIECGFERVDGYLFSPAGESPGLLQEELAAARTLGVRGVKALARVPWPSFDTGPCLHFPRQAQFHPMEYVHALAREAVKLGARLFEHSHVEDYELGDRVKVTVTGGRSVTADSVVFATNAPLVSRVSVPLRQAAYRTYVIAMEAPPDVPRALCWDTADPYHYVRLHDEGRRSLLIVGGEDHKTGQPAEGSAETPFLKLAGWTRERFPGAGETIYRWSGQIMEPADGLAFLGRYESVGKNVYVATGDSGHGLTHGTLAGLIIRDQILGRANPWEVLYSPGRLTLKSIGEMAKEALNTIPQYGKWLTPGDTKSTEDVPRGEGRVVRLGLKKIAAYRDEQGLLLACSAACPHLGAVVGWNDTEKTWDCPAHGSRFSATGEVLNGPANTALAPAELPEPKEAHLRETPSPR